MFRYIFILFFIFFNSAFANSNDEIINKLTKNLLVSIIYNLILFKKQKTYLKQVIVFYNIQKT